MKSSQEKVVSLSKLQSISRSRRNKKQKMVFTNGCFDILHVGHVNYLEQARSLGDYLVVALNSDRSVRELKGKNRPINDEKSRARVLAALQCVDHVVVFKTKRVTPVIQKIRPQIYVKGGDYSVASLDIGERSAVLANRGVIKILPVWKGYSTTKTIKKMRAK
jgi:rfaE bifunctional protein nucleotidyltransferase chain/domain